MCPPNEQTLIVAVFDTNAVDPLVDKPGIAQALAEARDAGRLRVLYTHVVMDEIAKVPDPERSQALAVAMASLGKPVPTGAFILDVSRLDAARLTSGPASVEKLRSNNIKHSRDALIGSTAQFEGAWLVTEDKRLAKQARALGITVASVDRLAAAVST